MGIAGRSIGQLFNLINFHEDQKSFSVFMTMYQIYNEKFFDLLNFNIHGTDAYTRMASQIPLKMLENEEGF